MLSGTDCLRRSAGGACGWSQRPGEGGRPLRRGPGRSAKGPSPRCCSSQCNFVFVPALCRTAAVPLTSLPTPGRPTAALPRALGRAWESSLGSPVPARFPTPTSPRVARPAIRCTAAQATGAGRSGGPSGVAAKESLPGLEPTTFGFQVQRPHHSDTEPMFSQVFARAPRRCACDASQRGLWKGAGPGARGRAARGTSEGFRNFLCRREALAHCESSVSCASQAARSAPAALPNAAASHCLASQAWACPAVRPRPGLRPLRGARRHQPGACVAAQGACGVSLARSAACESSGGLWGLAGFLRIAADLVPLSTRESLHDQARCRLLWDPSPP